MAISLVNVKKAMKGLVVNLLKYLILKVMSEELEALSNSVYDN